MDTNALPLLVAAIAAAGAVLLFWRVILLGLFTAFLVVMALGLMQVVQLFTDLR